MLTLTAAPAADVDELVPRRPALRYYGGKWRLAPWIIKQLPPHRLYVESFGGAGSVLLRKPRVKIEVYNDVDNEIVSFFRVLRERSEELIRAIHLTPFSRTEFELAVHRDWSNELEAARRLYVRFAQAIHGGARENRTGWRRSKDVTRRTTEVQQFAGTEHLWAIVERLRGVQIECGDALRVISRYDTPEALHYVDPPYPKHTRSATWGRDGYRHEYTTMDHQLLLSTLLDCRGMVVLSGYRCSLYDEVLADWRRIDRDAQTMSGRAVTECLWMNAAAVAAVSD